MFDVQFITHFTASISYPDSARIALEGGCRWVQLRMKDASEEELKNTAMHVQELCRQYGATFIIDDRVDLVKEIGADGDRKSTRLNSSHANESRMPSSA